MSAKAEVALALFNCSCVALLARIKPVMANLLIELLLREDVAPVPRGTPPAFLPGNGLVLLEQRLHAAGAHH